MEGAQSEMEVREGGWKEIGTEEIKETQTDADTVDQKAAERKRQIKAGDTRTDSAGTVPLSLPVTQSPCSPGWIGAAQVGPELGGGLQDRFRLLQLQAQSSPHLMGRPRGRPQYRL